MSISHHIHPLYAAMGTTVFERMSALSRELGAINLGQGFPEGGGPAPLQQAAVRALQDRSAQYPPSDGLPELREAICAFYAARQGLSLRPEEVIVTSGATEAIASAILALVQPGDEVIVFEPAYDAMRRWFAAPGACRCSCRSRRRALLIRWTCWRRRSARERAC